MKSIILLILFVLLVLINADAPRPGVLAGINQPDSIAADRDVLFVLEGATVHAFNLKTLARIRSFGRPGEGPGEMMAVKALPNSLTLLPGRVVVQSLTKVIFFTEVGEVLREIKSNPRILKILPVGKHLAVKESLIRDDADTYHWAVTLFDKEMKKIRELFRQTFPIQPDREGGTIPLAADALNFWVYRDKIYIDESPLGFQIGVYDSNGRKQLEIRRPQPVIQLSRSFKSQSLALLKDDFELKKVNYFVPAHILEAGWPEFSKWATLVFPETVPALRDIRVTGDRIYVKTFIQRPDGDHWQVLDLSGTSLFEITLPSVRSTAFVSRMLGTGAELFTIQDDRFIYLLENEETEEWQVFSIAISRRTSTGRH